MKKFPYILLSLASIPFLALGLLFLISAVGNSTRLLPGLAFIAIGIFLLVIGLRKLRRIAATSPDVLRTGAIDLAKQLGGELTVSQLRAEFKISQQQAQDVLSQLEAEGNCEREQREERLVYVFNGLLPSMVEKSCPYCGNKLPVRSSLRKCPNCGAQLEITKS